MLDAILNLLYPNVCGFCDKICKESLCRKCELKLKKYEILPARNEAVAIFRNRNNNFNCFISILKYEDIIRKKIIEYKFGDKSYLYKTFAKVILRNENACRILENGYIESFNARMRDEHLNGELFGSMCEAQVLTARWVRYYNGIRPHSSLGGKPPAPQSYVIPTELGTNLIRKGKWKVIEDGQSFEQVVGYGWN